MPHEEVLAECQAARAVILERLKEGDKQFVVLIVKIDRLLEMVSEMKSDHEIRLVKLEEEKKTRVWWNRTIGGAVLALVIEAIWNALKK